MQNGRFAVDRSRDAYFSPPKAVARLLQIESQDLLQCVWEPAASDGAIVRHLQAAGSNIIVSDIADYSLDACAAIYPADIDYTTSTGKSPKKAMDRLRSAEIDVVSR
jgi:hypothetical protein